MYVRIEKGSSVPISRQIAEQIRSQCLSGVLKGEECLPSVRQLARDLAVNANTILRVYERLSAEGLIEMRHGEGTFVLPSSASNRSVLVLKKQREQFSREFQAIVRRGLLLGLKLQELRQMLSSAGSDAKAQIAEELNQER